MNARRLLQVSTLGASLALTPLARAQSDDVSAPRLVEDPGVAYPRRALDERYYASEEVVLVLSIRATSASGSVFCNGFFDMTDAIGSSREDGPPDFDERSDGYAVGLELHLERRLTERVGGFLTYTLSRSVRRVDGEEFAASFDRTHVVNAALAFDLGRAWRSGARLVFYTGAPEDLATSDARTDPFFRVDLRLEKGWSFGGTRYLSFVTEVMNASLSKETFGTDEVGPIVLPSVGVEAGVLMKALDTVPIVLATLALSCLPDDTRPPPGKLTVGLTVSDRSPELETEDGWRVSFDEIFLGIRDVELTGDDCNAYNESDYLRLLDLRRPGAQHLNVAYALGHCELDFGVASPSRDTVLGAGVDAQAAEAMRKKGTDAFVEDAGTALYVRGHATRDERERGRRRRRPRRHPGRARARAPRDNFHEPVRDARRTPLPAPRARGRSWSRRSPMPVPVLRGRVLSRSEPVPVVAAE